MASQDTLRIEIATNIGALNMTNQGQLGPNYSFSVVLPAIIHPAMKEQRVGDERAIWMSYHFTPDFIWHKMGKAVKDQIRKTI